MSWQHTDWLECERAGVLEDMVCDLHCGLFSTWSGTRSLFGLLRCSIVSTTAGTQIWTNLTSDPRGQESTHELNQLACASKEPPLDYPHRNTQKEEQALKHLYKGKRFLCTVHNVMQIIHCSFKWAAFGETGV